MKQSLSVKRRFASYVAKNIIGMLGISCYILIDTFFISQVAGSNGITVLNLCLPLYNLIYAFGAMIGTGSAIRFSMEKASGRDAPSRYLVNACAWVIGLGVLFMLIGALLPGQLLHLMGGDAEIVALGVPYLRTFMLFAPFFMLNQVLNAFVRNDGNPSLAMIATLLSSLFNALFDYVLMFPLGLGLFGAALATAFSPLVGIGICLLHAKHPHSTLRFLRIRPSFRLLTRSCRVGVSAFVGEFSAGVMTTVFNFLLLGLAGNVGVAAYGVTANLAIVAVSLFNGIAQGSQPLISEHCAKGDARGVRALLRLGILSSLFTALLLYLAVYAFAGEIVSVFNSEGSREMARLGVDGLRLYFLGFFFSGCNMVISGYFSATDQSIPAMVVSLCRGLVLIVLFAFLLAMIFGITGVWIAYPVAEGATLLIGLLFLLRSQRPAARRS